MPKKRTFWPVFWLLALATLAGTAWWWFSQPRLIAEVGKVQKGQATAAVYGTVLVEPVVQTIVRAQTSGVISSVKVKKGDIVKQGDILAEIADETASQLLKAAMSALETEVRRREIGPATKPATEAKRSQIKQLEKLLQEGNIARSEYERNLSELKTLEDKVKSEQLALDAAVQEAEQRLDAASSQHKQGQVRSPQNGIVLEFYTQLGELISTRNEIFLIGSEKCHIRAQVNEEDVGALKKGMSAMVRLYSYPNKNFPATLQEVLPQGGNQEYSVILTIDQPPERMLPGMTGEINIILGRKEKALIVPTRAVRSGTTPFLMVVEDGVVRTRSVKVGIRSIEMAEILEGVKEDDLVVLSDHDLFKPGQRVRWRLRE